MGSCEYSIRFTVHHNILKMFKFEYAKTIINNCLCPDDNNISKKFKLIE